MHTNSFWNRFQEWYSISSNTKLLLSELEVMFGIISYHTYRLAQNHLFILGTYFLYVNALNTLIYKFDDFILLVQEKLNKEKYIAVTCNKEKNLGTNGIFFCLYKIILCLFLFDSILTCLFVVFFFFSCYLFILRIY